MTSKAINSINVVHSQSKKVSKPSKKRSKTAKAAKKRLGKAPKKSTRKARKVRIAKIESMGVDNESNTLQAPCIEPKKAGSNKPISHSKLRINGKNVVIFDNWVKDYQTPNAGGKVAQQVFAKKAQWSYLKKSNSVEKSSILNDKRLYERYVRLQSTDYPGLELIPIVYKSAINESGLETINEAQAEKQCEAIKRFSEGIRKAELLASRNLRRVRLSFSPKKWQVNVRNSGLLDEIRNHGKVESADYKISTVSSILRKEINVQKAPIKESFFSWILRKLGFGSKPTIIKQIVNQKVEDVVVTKPYGEFGVEKTTAYHDGSILKEITDMETAEESNLVIREFVDGNNPLKNYFERYEKISLYEHKRMVQKGDGSSLTTNVRKEGDETITTSTEYSMTENGLQKKPVIETRTKTDFSQPGKTVTTEIYEGGNLTQTIIRKEKGKASTTWIKEYSQDGIIIKSGNFRYVRDNGDIFAKEQELVNGKWEEVDLESIKKKLHMDSDANLQNSPYLRSQYDDALKEVDRRREKVLGMFKDELSSLGSYKSFYQ